MEQSQSKSNIVGLIALFLLFIPAGIIVHYVYIGTANLIGNIWLHVFASIGAGFALFAVVDFLKKLFKITNNTGAIVAVALGLPLIHYLKWVFYIVFLYTGLNPFLDAPEFFQETWHLITNYSIGEFINFMQELNEIGWTLSMFGFETDMQGALLWVIWVVELVIMAGFPIVAATTVAGVYLYSHNAWAKPRYLDYFFEEFSKEERELIIAGNINLILEKPTAIPVQHTTYSTVAVCYIKNEPTEYIALYTSNVDDKGKPGYTPISGAINVGKDKIAELEAQLAEKHTMVETTSVEPPENETPKDETPETPQE